MDQPLPRPQYPSCGQKFLSTCWNSLSDWLYRPYDPRGVREGVTFAVSIDAFQFAHILSKYLGSPVNAASLASGATAMYTRSTHGQEPSVALPSAISASN